MTRSPQPPRPGAWIVWFAAPCPMASLENREGWTAWRPESVYHSATLAHRSAAEGRKLWPGHLFAVRAATAGAPKPARGAR